MSVQQFCLRWNNHQPNFISVFTSLLNSESLVDVTLAAEGKHLQAHKVVLSACSVYFQTLFTANPSRHPIVILKDVKHADLKILVNFMYYGEVNVSQEQLPQILETAKMLKIKGLTEMPEPAVSNIHTNSERPNLLTPGDSSWHSDIQRHSISPHNLSPSIRRKRHRKSSAGSRSTSVERISEGKSFGDSNNLAVGKSDAIMLNSLNVNQFCSNKARIKEQQINDYNVSKDSFDENGGMDQNLTINTEEEPNDCNLMRGSEHPLEETTGTGLSQQASQWTLMDHGYPRYTASCQANSIHSISSINMNNIHSSQENSIHSFGMPSVINPYDYQAQGQTQSQVDEMDDTSPGPSCSNVLTNVLADSQQILPPPKRRRTSNPQSEENFQRALEAVRFGGIGFCKAARMFGVNNRTLWLEYKKKGYPNNRPSIKNRIKQEHSTPPPEIREELPSVQDQQLTLLCPPHPVGMMGFIDSRHVDFASSIPNVNRPRFVEENMNIHTSPINLHGINFNSIQ